MGGGFNNTTLWLVESDKKNAVIEYMQQAYQKKFGENREAKLDFVQFEVAPGVGRLK